jgi:hypothetical protein
MTDGGQMRNRFGKGLRTALSSFVAGVGLLLATSASAQTLQLMLQEGITPPVMVTDNGALDANATLGVIVYSGPVGAFTTLNVFSALSKPGIGTPTQALADIFTLVSSGGVSGTLTVKMTDTGFPGPVGGTGTVTSAVGGNLTASATFQTYVDPSNTPFGTTGCTTGPQVVSTSPFASSATAPCEFNGPFSITTVDIATLGPTDSITFDHSVTVESPECGAIGDYVWLDLNRNGIQDAGEPGINGVRLILESGGIDIATTTTGLHPIGGAAGYYQFSRACAGTYSVRVDPATIPAGLAATLTNAGADDTIDNDSDGQPVPVTLLVDGDSNQTIDFGFLSPCTGTIGNFVWNDLNQNGVQDLGEPGISGVQLRLVESNQTTITGANGEYQFSGLCAGTYTVEVVSAPAGMTPTIVNAVGDTTVDSNFNPATVTLLVDNASDQTIDFGYYAPCTGAIGDFVWTDLNRNGIQDPGEPGIQGAKVYLKNAGGTILQTVFTDVNGHYAFNGLCGGNFVVEVDPASVPPTLTPSPSGQGGDPTKDSNGSPTTVVLPPNSVNPTIDFGYMPPCTGVIGDFVWNDLNRNGLQGPGEPGIGGVLMELRRQSDNSLMAVTTTAANGFYQFVGLCAGDYKVVVVPPAGFPYVATLSGVGADRAIDSNGSPALVTLPTDFASDLTIDFGYWQPAALGDFVWSDLNANGVQDAGEPGIAGVAVSLYPCGSAVAIATVMTDGGGLYLFSNLTAGCYYVKFGTPSGFTASPANVGADAADSDSVGGTTGNYTLAPGETNRTVDAGFYRPASLGDFVWKDLNSNGTQDVGEPGIAGVLATLLRCDGTPTGLTTTTNATGFYLFSNLAPGCYKVQFGTPAGYTPSPSNVGANDAVDSDAVAGVSGNYTLNAGDNNLTVDAGFVLTPPVCITATFDFTTGGNSALYGAAGNIRSFSSGGVNVHVSAFGRNKTSGAFAAAFLGQFSNGLGVTDSTEGTGGSNSHVVDNSGQDNYVLFEFSQAVVVDKAYLAYIVGDSDVTVWVGNVANAYTSHINLNAAALTGLGFTEVNLGGDSDRWADLNAGGVSGNVVVIAAKVGDTVDGFKLAKVAIGCPTTNVCTPVGTVSLTGNSSTSGTTGNIRNFSVNGVNINASAFSRTDSGAAWDKAFLGAYSGGLGVTDSSEGTGSNDKHKTDNIGGRNNYVLFEFSQSVEVNRAFLDSVGADSDVSVWIGTKTNPYTSHLTLSDALLSSLAKEDNATPDTSSVSRWADFNAAKLSGNVLVISALVGDTSPEDAFKVSKLDITCK